MSRLTRRNVRTFQRWNIKWNTIWNINIENSLLDHTKHYKHIDHRIHYSGFRIRIDSESIDDVTMKNLKVELIILTWIVVRNLLTFPSQSKSNNDLHFPWSLILTSSTSSTACNCCNCLVIQFERWLFVRNSIMELNLVKMDKSDCWGLPNLVQSRLRETKGDEIILTVTSAYYNTRNKRPFRCLDNADDVITSIHLNRSDLWHSSIWYSHCKLLIRDVII